MNETSARLACFELWGGNRSEDHTVELPGLLGWVYSVPLDSASGGGDLHYFSVCSKGMISRIAVADVAGHGPQANSMAVKLREALQQHTDHWDQSALMQELNEAFLSASARSPYATAAVLSFYRDTAELLFSNAGHPPPLWYRASERSWHFLEDCTPFAVDIEGLPLGVIPGTTYSQTGVQVGFGDLLVLYTDGITETIDSSNNELGNTGLLKMAKGLADKSPVEVIRALTSDIQTFRGDAPRRDDETLVVLECVGVS
ncbi:MAG TPA: PP2C family protein-serine/threonine phosphatase [Terriglobia bacterium]|nr:PP2C family protein-serine/threonine phosphatase [Terriglobia bacterium]